MKKYFLSCVIVFLGLFVFLNSLLADGTVTVNGVPITLLDEDSSGVVGIYSNRYVSYSVGTSNVYVYNNVGGTLSSAGCLKIRGFPDKVVQIEITNMSDAGTNTIGFFMANGTTTPTVWSLIYEAVYNGTVTDSIMLSEPHDYGRIGVRRSGTSAADFTVTETYTRPK